ncbi:hypothetical protein DQP58_10865 [Mycobacterium colombiense]|uniref:Uncharacterized protein n=1 Tax=Mycobacterium colombiense TaxID=339268 RepID=A0A329KJQ0_9MYCO|nr:hypothetical protein [Mycobacterium colombiense]RAU96028.1 hypothetical protein DQP58_10865 [Mycobacterium colombiense]
MIDAYPARAAAVNNVIDLPSRQARAQTVTTACPVERIEQFGRDPDQSSVVLGDIAEIDVGARDHYRWKMSAEPGVERESTPVGAVGLFVLAFIAVAVLLVMKMTGAAG